MANPSAIIFDCDGTLVDSETLSLKVLVDLFTEYGLVIPVEEAIRLYAGVNLYDVFDELRPRATRPLTEDVIQRFRDRQIAELKRSLRPIDGATDMLESLTVPYCVASNAPRYKIEVCLETSGLRSHFEDAMIFSAYDRQKWKPDPDLFVTASKAMGVAAETCVVVEDSVPGVQAGIAAGMHVIAFDPHGRLAQSHPEVTHIQSLRQLTGKVRQAFC
ncbi:MAG: HAD-IA family hydrolase [Planctomycetota bacterium]